MAQVNKKQALGKGIRALLDTIDEELQSPHEGVPAVSGHNLNAIARIPVDDIEVNPKQPRRDFDEVALKELAESIAIHDIIQPVTVVRTGHSRYMLISGERRWRASKMAGLADIPAYVRTADSQGMLELALIENLQREDLNAIEIALSYKQLIDECGLTHEGLSERMNKQRTTVTNYLRLLKLPPDIQKAVRDNEISMGHARAIVGLDHVDQQLYVYRETLQKGLSVRQTELLVKNLEVERTPASPKTVPPKLPQQYKRIEDNMASLFSTKVKLARGSNGKGNILIEFYNDNDLERIMDKMKL